MYNQNPPPYSGGAPGMAAPVYPPGIQGVVVTGAPAVVIPTVTQVAAPLREVPGGIFCVFCQRNVITKTSLEISTMAWLACCGLALLGCWPCMCIPFCLDSCNDINHYCPSCNHLLHVYRRK